MTLTQKELKKNLYYNYHTGVFTWLIKKSRSSGLGITAGYTEPIGYIQIKINGIKYRAHRLAFLYMEGAFPEGQIDHINRIKSDNSWCNIRQVTNKQNHENMNSNNSFIGVCWHSVHNKWVAYASTESTKRNHIGYYDTHLAACNARHNYDSE